MCPSTGLKMVLPNLKKEQPCNDLLSEGDCADGKLHCRPTVSTKPRRSIDAAAIIEEVFNNLKKRTRLNSIRPRKRCSSLSFPSWRPTQSSRTTPYWSVWSSRSAPSPSVSGGSTTRASCM
jgi:hypothetical protein